MRRATLALVILGLIAGGCSLPSGQSAPEMAITTGGVCSQVSAWTDVVEEVQESRAISDETADGLPDLAKGFADAAEQLAHDGETTMARAMLAVAQRLLGLMDDIAALQRGEEAPTFGENLTGATQALLAGRPRFCSSPDEYHWVFDDAMEVSVPDAWPSTTVAWSLPGVDGTFDALLASDNNLRWLEGAPATVVPGVLVARLDSVAEDLKLRRRFAGVLDQVRGLVERLDRSELCEGGEIQKLGRGVVQHGFARSWHDCDGRGIALVETVQARVLPGGDVTLVYLLATVYAPGDQQPVIDALASFHLDTDPT